MFKDQKARAMTQRQKFRLNLKIPDHDQVIGEDKTAEIRYMRDKLGSPNTNNMTITSAKGLASQGSLKTQEQDQPSRSELGRMTPGGKNEVTIAPNMMRNTTRNAQRGTVNFGGIGFDRRKVSQ